MPGGRHQLPEATAMERMARAFVGGILGTGAGVAFGLALGQLIAPVVNPRQKLEHEWYIMAVYAYIIASGIEGMFLGCICGAFPHVKTTGCCIAGLALGCGVGYLLWDNGPSPPHHAYTGVTIIYSAFGTALCAAIAGAVWSARSPAQRPALLPSSITPCP